jgi:hypothetical protein
LAGFVELELRTRHLPPVRWNSEAEASSTVHGSGGGRAAGFDLGELVLRWLRPAIEVRTPFGTWTRAPHGDPGTSSWPLVPYVAGVIAIVVVAFAAVGCWVTVKAIARSAA